VKLNDRRGADQRRERHDQILGPAIRGQSQLDRLRANADAVSDRVYKRLTGD
jgi:hypothetical protein